MDKRILLFNKHFELWGIALPPDAEQRCPRGTSVSRGWTVKYCFGKDQDGKFLDYYAAHRMTNDRHLRIRDNGNVEGLPAYPDALQLWEPKYVERATKLLEAKGFGITGDEHGSYLVHDYLRRKYVAKTKDANSEEIE